MFMKALFYLYFFCKRYKNIWLHFTNCRPTGLKGANETVLHMQHMYVCGVNTTCELDLNTHKQFYRSAYSH